MRVVLCRSRLSVRRSPAERRLLLRCHVRHSRTEFRCVKFTIMGAHRHGQRGGGTCSPWKCCSVLALVLTVKRSVDQLFMHYFHNLSSASGRFAPPLTLTGSPPLDPAGGLSSLDPLICPPLKNPAGAHVHDAPYVETWKRLKLSNIYSIVI